MILYEATRTGTISVRPPRVSFMLYYAFVQATNMPTRVFSARGKRRIRRRADAYRLDYVRQDRARGRQGPGTLTA